MRELPLAAGADIESSNSNWERLLEVEIDTGEIAMVMLLLSLGVNVNKLNEHSLTALHKAASCHFSNVFPVARYANQQPPHFIL